MDSPFYDKKGEFSIYEDRLVLHKLKGRVVKFSDIYQIIFRKIDFSLYVPSKNNKFTVLSLKDGENIEIDIPLSGYYALKKYYEKGIRSNGMDKIYITATLSIVSLLVFLAIVYVYVLK